MKASERPRCALCSQPVFVKDSAWISHHYGKQAHFDCIEAGEPTIAKAALGWYRRLTQR